MASLNKVYLIGNLTRDPEKRYTPSGTAVCEARLAVNHKYKTANGEWKEDPCFVSVTIWGKTAENVVEYKRKGDPLLIEGRLKYDQWEKEGQKFSKIVVVADSVQFLPRGQQGGGGGGGGGGNRSTYGDAPEGGDSYPPPEPVDEPPAQPYRGGGGGMPPGPGGEEKPDGLPF